MTDVDRLAALIREVDGSHSLGAGALAEKLIARGVQVPRPPGIYYAGQKVGVHDHKPQDRCPSDCPGLMQPICREPNDGPNWVRDRFYCSLSAGHDGPHVAYTDHVVTGSGRDVVWLGPWKDGREYKGEQTDRLIAEWTKRNTYVD